ncbi:MAG TPA: efflux RND transporter periplasmic adaptor subunit [Terracidiphilus sp.]|jgi:RND family efflux transporter MFP subunit|nr:efflux RND transporter periplasmic adaptor subunit [Terracidiphilus sp.]
MKLILSGCFLVAASALVAGCHSDVAAKAATVQTVQARVVESQLQQSPMNLRATGTLHAHETAVLSAQLVGRIQQVMVREGDFVRAGQTLVVLDDATLRASTEQAEAAVKAADNQQAAAQTNSDLAASTLARYKQLQIQKSVSPQEMDEVTRRAEASAAQVDALRAQGNSAKAQASGARAMLEYTRIRAPFAGVVTARMADPGSLAAPGVPLLQVDSAGPLQLQATLDESAIAAVHVGMKIQVSIDGAPTASPAGTVAQIIPAADPASHTFLIKIDLAASKQLRAGMYGTAEVPMGAHPAILAPNSSIVVRGSLPCAYVLDGNGVAQLRYVTLGAVQGNLVEILSGISSGEKLVDDPSDRDLAGKRIEVQP